MSKVSLVPQDQDRAQLRNFLAGYSREIAAEFPSEAEVAEQAAETVRLAAYTPEEKTVIRSNFSADAADLLLKPSLSWQEKIARLKPVPVAIAALLALAVIALIVFMIFKVSSANGAESNNGAGFIKVSDLKSGKSDIKTDAQTAAEAGDNTDAKQKIFVHLVGEIQKPGVYELPAGSRVQDALKAAGGAKETAVLEKINLARQIVDGEQILIPNQETSAAISSDTVSLSPDNSGSALISLNQANAEQLQTLPKIGAVTAEKIIDWRKKHGGFKNINELLEIPGIGERTLAEIREKITL